MLNYRVDVVAITDELRLAIEGDGAQHTATRAQIAADYLREPRILRSGLLVIRFTGGELIKNPTLVWRELFAPLAVWQRLARSA